MVPSDAILGQIESLGYRVEIARRTGGVTLTAMSLKSGERFIVNEASGDEYTAACTLAKMVLKERRSE